MKVVWVTPGVPHPAAAGGWANEYELISALTDRHEIEVVSSDIGDPLGPGALVAAGAGFTRVAWEPQPYPATRLRLASAVLRADPSLSVWLKRTRLAPLAAAVRELAVRFRPDLVHVTQQELAPLAARLPLATGLLLYDSLTREIEGRLALERQPRRRAQLRLELRRTLRFERRWYPEATGLAAVSNVDAEWVRREVGSDVRVIENSVADRLFEPPDRPRSGGTVLFVGTLNHHPNEDAIAWLAQDIWPHVRARNPAARLRVLGRDDQSRMATDRLRPLIEAVGGELLVDVDDVRPHYWEAAAVIAPMRLGGGMRSKVIHAMAAGAPLISTPTGMEGVLPAATRHVAIGTTAQQLAEEIGVVLSDPAAAQVRAAAAASSMRHLSATSVAERLEAWWRSLVR